uniref:Uncharacterized protein n=1 Tax=Meloidogyne hapla TaxID=6305 RepID=A0A1I8BE39_MELHA
MDLHQQFSDSTSILPHQMQSNDGQNVNRHILKYIREEITKDKKSNSYRYKWINDAGEHGNYHLVEETKIYKGEKTKRTYIGCNRCRRYVNFSKVI